jgi:pyruvate, water dikinase
MSGVVPLAAAHDVSLYGSKAVGLGEAARAGLPLPPGVALSGAIVEAVAAGDRAAIQAVDELVRPLGGALAVRSSAVDEDGAEASFAGQHLTVLNVPSADSVGAALREVWWSANSDSAISYRRRLRVVTRPSVGVVVQELLDPESAGVIFTRNPINGADERVIEASWGLGEAVVAGLVIPDHFRIDRHGQVLERVAGLKRIAIRTLPDGGTAEQDVPAEHAEQLCLDDDQLAALNRLELRGGLRTRARHRVGVRRRRAVPAPVPGDNPRRDRAAAGQAGRPPPSSAAPDRSQTSRRTSSRRSPVCSRSAASPPARP